MLTGVFDLVEGVLDLVQSFDDENGVSEATYAATCLIVENVLGMESRKVIEQYVNATDGRFYLNPETSHDLIKTLIEKQNHLAHYRIHR